jgi:hypothetical protein
VSVFNLSRILLPITKVGRNETALRSLVPLTDGLVHHRDAAWSSFFHDHKTKPLMIWLGSIAYAKFFV